MTVFSGLDILIASEFQILKNKSVGLLCNQASIARDHQHIVDVFKTAHQDGRFELRCLIGPQHGLWGHTQDNMIEWQGYSDRRIGVPVYSLYGEHREPTAEMLDGVETLVVDLQDVGAKYYTFIWSLFLSMKACLERGIEVVVLDRPNPINGEQVEGPFYNHDFKSFVGLESLAIRHGMTIGEIADYFKSEFYPESKLTVVEMENWRRSMWFEDTGLPWAMPSPNIPVADSCVVYPGMCLLEATNISEGRGTTRPFELFGASWMNGWKFTAELQKYHLPGVVFRPLEFQPTFHKHAGQICGGCFIHVTDRQAFRPFLTTIAMLHAVIKFHPEAFEWKAPPYEYEYEKMPFDILVGNDWLREMLDSLQPLQDLEKRWEAESTDFRKMRKQFLRYAS